MTFLSICTTAAVTTPAAALTSNQEDVIRHLAVSLTAAAIVLLLATTTQAATQNAARPALIARISKQIFHRRWKTAACIAHYESTDGAHLYNWPNLGPWQIDVVAHPWVDRARVVTDWRYSARVAYRISAGGRDWSPWSTRRLCGA